jgi:histidinol-phosphate aminotransferase
VKPLDAPDVLSFLQPHIRDAAPYVPVQPPETLAQRLGVPVERIIKLDANENPYGASPRALESLAATRSYHIYPDPEQRRLREAIGRYVGCDPTSVLVGAGSDELLEICVRLFVPPGEAILNFPPTFGMYSFLAGVQDARVINVNRRADHSLDIDNAVAAAEGARLVFVVSPNNPTGTPLSRAELDALLATGLPIVVDEAYAEFAGESYVGLVRDWPNLIVTRTFSKWAGLAGLRVGFMVAHPSLIEAGLRTKQPYSVNVAAEVAALASFDDLALLQERVRLIVAERERLTEALPTLPGFEVTPSRANFVLCRLSGVEAKRVHALLTERGIMVRYFDTPLLQNHLRISVGLPAQNDALLAALRDIVSPASDVEETRGR